MLQTIKGRYLFLILSLVVIFHAAPLSSYYIMNAPLDAYKGPFALSEFELPDAYADILSEYQKGNFRLCILKLNALLEMALPDGRYDNYLFIAGECYQQLKLNKFAVRLYRQLIDEYPASPYFKYATYRLQENAYLKDDSKTARLFFNMIQRQFGFEPIGFASKFIEAKRLYKKNKIAEADKLLVAIPAASALIHPATFIRGLCSITNNDIEKAVLQLDVVVKNTKNVALREEALLILSELYYKLKRDSLAIAFLKNIPEASPKYGKALLLSSQFLLKTGDLENAVLLGEKLLVHEEGAFMFEAAMVLEAAYLKKNQHKKIEEIRTYLELTVRKKKLVFDIYRELDILAEMQTRFNHFYLNMVEQYTSLDKKRRGHQIFSTVSYKITRLKNKYIALLKTLDREGHVLGSSGFHEIRYMEIVDGQIEVLTQRNDSLFNELQLLTAKRDTVNARAENALIQKRSALLDSIQKLNEIKEDIINYCLGENIVFRDSEDIQAKFVDWNFMRMSNLKDKLRSVYKEILTLERERKNPAKDRIKATPSK
jgi:tetratricopeptide (TPR) repeat protein